MKWNGDGMEYLLNSSRSEICRFLGLRKHNRLHALHSTVFINAIIVSGLIC